MKKITVTYTMVKPDRNEIAETQITLPTRTPTGRKRDGCSSMTC